MSDKEIVTIQVVKSHELDPTKKYVIEVKQDHLSDDQVSQFAQKLADMGIKSALLVMTESGNAVNVREVA